LTKKKLGGKKTIIFKAEKSPLKPGTMKRGKGGFNELFRKGGSGKRGGGKREYFPS